MKENEKMKSCGVTLTQEQWERCDRLTQQYGFASRNAFLREVVDFYFAYHDRTHIDKFLTPALESVISAKLRDSEERMARLLFKLAVGQNMLAHIAGGDYQYDDFELGALRAECIRELKETNGTLDVQEIYRTKGGGN